jgi:hypothetical protein
MYGITSCEKTQPVGCMSYARETGTVRDPLSRA